MNAFDNDKLQEQLDSLSYAVEPTKEFWDKEMEKCYKDQWYFYYWYFDSNVPKMTRDEYYQRIEYLRHQFFNNFK